MVPALSSIILFTNAVRVHGLPNRVRSDLGRENIDVWQFMAELHTNVPAVITGSSTHNEWIERLYKISQLYRENAGSAKFRRIQLPLRPGYCIATHWNIRNRLYPALCKHFSGLYMKAEIDQMLCGMAETLGSLDVIHSEPTVMRPIFIYSEKPSLSADDMFDIFTIHYSAS